METTDIYAWGEIPAADVSVFLNCPFDSEYEPLLNAILLAVLSCGFVPRIATETGSTAVSRIDRICAALHGSRFSIHDLSRCRGEGDHNLARFNMPLELGIAMGRRYATQGGDGQAHDWLVLVPDDHAYAPFISNLAGFDPGTHEETAETIVPAIMAWLLTRKDSPGVRSDITPERVLASLPRLYAAMEQLSVRWANASPPWPARVAEARSILPTV
ncbi:MAG: hypothetical protein QOF13_1989 [Solirubrobacterales bacterium]|jgi:hypothetical protein|nr:hypothetical protein [Solirubrobacterales bacterium]